MAGGLVLAAMTLGACGENASAVETRDRSTEAAGPVRTADMPAGEADTGAPANVKPVVTANRRETVDAKVTRLFERNGAAFGARSADDYLAKIQAFTGNPPSGTETATRPNGDTLYYQASTNTFAVVSRAGVPRTMFKPDDGPTYWAEQKAQAPTFGQRRTTDG